MYYSCYCSHCAIRRESRIDCIQGAQKVVCTLRVAIIFEKKYLKKINFSFVPAETLKSRGDFIYYGKTRHAKILDGKLFSI